MTPIDALVLAATATLVIASPMTGSFLKCWADRAAIGQPVTGRSYCDHCGTQLGARDLVPILSWVVNGGKSRCCGRKLRWTLMSAELTALGMALWAVLVVQPPLLLPTLIMAWLLQATMLMTTPDARIATVLSMILAVLALGVSLAGLAGEIEVRLLGFALGLLIAAVAWTGASDPEARYLKATTLFPATGAMLGVTGMGFAFGLALPAALAHWVLSKALGHEAQGNERVTEALSFGVAFGTWAIWLYADRLPGL